jgi:hypothetical protein
MADITTLKRVKGTDGQYLSGLWENEFVRMEKVEAGWEFQVPVREIGKTGYFEFRLLSADGKWRNAGVRRTRKGCCRIAEKLFSGEAVLKPGHIYDGVPIPTQVIPWSEVAKEISEHPSVTGAAA